MLKRRSIIVFSFIAVVVVGIMVYNVCKQAPKEELGIQLPESRSFYMGTTNLPYDFTPEAIEKTYKIVEEHTDLITHHIEGGVPWSEAFEGRPYRPRVEEDINSRLRHLKEGQKVYLALTPINGVRNSLAGYRGESDNMERPGEWKDKDFDDPDVITAYTNYCRRMIQLFQPDFMAYGIEVNMLANSNPAAFEKFLVMAEQVYGTLKEENPELPIFLTIQIDDTFHGYEEKQREVIKRLLPYTDYIAVSTYPFSYKADPKELPEDWFSEVAELAPEKPFAVAETSFIAEDLVLYGALWRSGNEKWQAEYVQFLLNKSNELNAKFIVWFVPIDYDLLWRKVFNMDEFTRIWRDTGLLNENKEARLSLRIWDAWLKLPVD